MLSHGKWENKPTDKQSAPYVAAYYSIIYPIIWGEVRTVTYLQLKKAFN